MSEASPFTFEAIDDNGLVHYVLRDVSGRVVCKALRDDTGVVVWAGGYLDVNERARGYTEAELEVLMRAVVHGQ